MCRFVDLFRSFFGCLKLTKLGCGVGFDKAEAIEHNGKSYSRTW